MMSAYASLCAMAEAYFNHHAASGANSNSERLYCGVESRVAGWTQQDKSHAVSSPQIVLLRAQTVFFLQLTFDVQRFI